MQDMTDQKETITKVSSTMRPSESYLVMLVDDDRDITEVLKLGLEGLGFSVDTYNDPLIALSEFKSEKYDIALLDIRMPKVTGFEIYRKLKAIDPKLKFCFLTAFEIRDSEFGIMFPDIKATKLLRKPVSISVLVKVLNELITERPQAPTIK